MCRCVDREKYAFLQRVLEKRGYAVVCAYGKSMQPLFKEGDRFVIEREPRYKVGDVVLISIGDDALRLHRIVRMKRDRILTLGDHSRHLDCVRNERVLGRAVCLIPHESDLVVPIAENVFERRLFTEISYQARHRPVLDETGCFGRALLKAAIWLQRNRGLAMRTRILKRAGASVGPACPLFSKQGHVNQVNKRR